MSKTPRKKRPVKDPNATPETKPAKFSRLATARINTAVKKISLIANLAGPGYEYTPEQVEKIEATLTETVAATMARFVKTKAADKAPIMI